jgi:hypothetical protein
MSLLSFDRRGELSDRSDERGVALTQRSQLVVASAHRDFGSRSRSRVDPFRTPCRRARHSREVEAVEGELGAVDDDARGASLDRREPYPAALDALRNTTIARERGGAGVGSHGCVRMKRAPRDRSHALRGTSSSSWALWARTWHGQFDGAIEQHRACAMTDLVASEVLWTRHCHALGVVEGRENRTMTSVPTVQPPPVMMPWAPHETSVEVLVAPGGTERLVELTLTQVRSCE